MDRAIKRLIPPLLALIGGFMIFGVFLATQGVNPITAYGLIWLGAFGTWFSWQNTLVGAAPILLTGLCVALPAQMGLLIIGGEGAFVLGGLASVAAGLALNGLGCNDYLTLVLMAAAGMTAGGGLIAFCGILRIKRGVNETISSLLLAYIS
ncbi:MAG: ABC transporter permease, partial [Acidocella sp.]|nr:ABC transporter permease [Acidocella sp.]